MNTCRSLFFFSFLERDPVAHGFTLFDLDFKKSDKMGHADKGFVFAERPAWCCVLPSLLLGCMCGRTVGIFNQAIFRSPLVDGDRRTAKEEVVRAERERQRRS